jgi:hypothetical protein
MPDTDRYHRELRASRSIVVEHKKTTISTALSPVTTHTQTKGSDSDENQQSANSPLLLTRGS